VHPKLQLNEFVVEVSVQSKKYQDTFCNWNCKEIYNLVKLDLWQLNLHSAQVKTSMITNIIWAGEYVSNDKKLLSLSNEMPHSTWSLEFQLRRSIISFGHGGFTRLCCIVLSGGLGNSAASPFIVQAFSHQNGVDYWCKRGRRNILK